MTCIVPSALPLASYFVSCISPISCPSLIIYCTFYTSCVSCISCTSLNLLYLLYCGLTIAIQMWFVADCGGTDAVRARHSRAKLFTGVHHIRALHVWQCTISGICAIAHGDDHLLGAKPHASMFPCDKDWPGGRTRPFLLRKNIPSGIIASKGACPCRWPLLLVGFD